MARARYEPGADVTAWAFAIARRLLIDRARSSRRKVALADADPEDAHAAPSSDPERAAQIGQAARRLGRALAALPESQRVAFELIKVEGLSVAETASRVAATDIAVKLRAHRAQEALRDVYLEAVA
jgi:RNA polymerase sigma-70 factor (ECF subfamily)